MKKFIYLLLLTSLVSLFWLGWPVYDFYAHRGKLPLIPFGFIEIPTQSPESEKLADSYYQEAGKKGLKLLTEHKLAINAPAISAAVAIDGQTVWAGSSGWADIENRLPASTETLFRLGSTSKALTATGLARLVDVNKIELDTSIAHYLSELPNPEWQNITSRHLISHLSGLPHYGENTDKLGLYQTLSLSRQYDNVTDAISVFDDSQLLFEPGSDFFYSSLGTVLLSSVMQAAAETSYQDWMNKAVFSPLGMTSTQAEPQENKPENLARFYWNNKGTSQEVKEWRKVNLSHRLAGGGFISTSSDLVKLGSGFLDSQFISRDTRQIFWTPQTLPDGSLTPHQYALGWRIASKDLGEAIGEITVVNHGGVSRGAQSWLMVIPEHNMAIAVNINANTEIFWDFGKVSMELAQLFITQKLSKQPPLTH